MTFLLLISLNRFPINQVLYLRHWTPGEPARALAMGRTAFFLSYIPISRGLGLSEAYTHALHGIDRELVGSASRYVDRALAAAATLHYRRAIVEPDSRRSVLVRVTVAKNVHFSSTLAAAKPSRVHPGQRGG